MHRRILWVDRKETFEANVPGAQDAGICNGASPVVTDFALISSGLARTVSWVCSMSGVAAESLRQDVGVDVVLRKVRSCLRRAHR